LLLIGLRKKTERKKFKDTFNLLMNCGVLPEFFGRHFFIQNCANMKFILPDRLSLNLRGVGQILATEVFCNSLPKSHFGTLEVIDIKALLRKLF
jgi:hypothetical protein